MSKLEVLRDTLAGYGQVVVAFSGGVDSAFLLKVAAEALGDRCHAVTAVSPTMARSEVADAIALAQELGLGERHHIVDSHELEVPGFSDNPTNRCALCKTELMDVAAPPRKMSAHLHLESASHHGPPLRRRGHGPAAAGRIEIIAAVQRQRRPKRG